MKSITGKELARSLARHGWFPARQHGSHHISCRPGSPVRISVPVHSNTGLKKGLAAHLLRQASRREEDV